MSNKILVQDHEIMIAKGDYISLTDIANSKDGEARAADIIKNWMRNRSTLEFIGTWEELYNPDFKLYLIKEFQRLKEMEFIQFLYISLGSLAELETQLLLAKELGYYFQNELFDDIIMIRKPLLGLIRHLKAKK